MNLPSTETPQLPLPSHPDRRGWGAPGLTANSPPQQWTLIFPKVSRKKTGILGRRRSEWVQLDKQELHQLWLKCQTHMAFWNYKWLWNA